MTELELTIAQAKINVRESELELKEAIGDLAKLERLEAEPKIVTFNSTITIDRLGVPVLTLPTSNLFKPSASLWNVAVSEKPFVSYSGVELARGVVDGRASSFARITALNPGDDRPYIRAEVYARPGNIVAVIGGGE